MIQAANRQYSGTNNHRLTLSSKSSSFSRFPCRDKCTNSATACKSRNTDSLSRPRQQDSAFLVGVGLQLQCMTISIQNTSDKAAHFVVGRHFACLSNDSAAHQQHFVR